MPKNIKPISLEDVEMQLLSKEKLKGRRNIVVEQENDDKERYKAIEYAMDKRDKRRVITFIVIFLALLLLVPIFFPDRYQVVKDVISMFLAGVSGFTFGKMKVFQTQ